MKHTLTPWKLQQSKIITGGDDDLPVALEIRGSNARQDDVNAEFIVKCVNQHDDLRYALSLLLNSYRILLAQNRIQERDREAISKFVKQAEQALAEVGETDDCQT